MLARADGGDPTDLSSFRLISFCPSCEHNLPNETEVCPKCGGELQHFPTKADVVARPFTSRRWERPRTKGYAQWLATSEAQKQRHAQPQQRQPAPYSRGWKQQGSQQRAWNPYKECWDSPDVCFKCGQGDHYSRDCPEWQREADEAAAAEARAQEEASAAAARLLIAEQKREKKPKPPQHA